MTFSLVIMDINTRRQTILSNLTETSDADQLMAEFRGALEDKYLRHSDPDIPVQRLGLLLGQLLLSKSEICVRQKLLHTKGPQASSLDYEVFQETLVLACRALEIGLELHTDELLRGFRWLTSTFTQYHLLTSILWNLCIYPSGPHVERAWRGVNTQFSMMEDSSWPAHGPKWPMIMQLRDKALRVRRAHESTEQSRQILNETRAFDDVGRPDAIFDIDAWDSNFLDFSDWNSLAQSLSLQI
jgi:hypothetical protein